ncbi:MAG: hypothetical protein QM401_12330 [Bacillota bacterium]|nr:hypothetical protein [Bacillota bacterium]
MNKRLISKNLVLFILLALVLSGCKIVGSKLDGGKNQTVQEYLASVGTAIESLDANKIADLIAFPIVIPLEFDDEDDVVWDIAEIKIEKADFIEYASTILTEIRNNKFELKVEINDPEEGTIEITGGGNSNEATVENAVLYITLEITEDAAKQALRNLQDKMMEILKEYINNADWDEDFKEAALKDLEDEEMDFEENWEDILIDLEMQEWPGEFELELPLMPLELTKEGKKWKLDVTAIFDSMLSSEYDDF